MKGTIKYNVNFFLKCPVEPQCSLLREINPQIACFQLSLQVFYCAVLKIIYLIWLAQVLYFYLTFFHYKWNVKVLWMFKVLHWTSDANKGPLFLRVLYQTWNIALNRPNHKNCHLALNVCRFTKIQSCDPVHSVCDSSSPQRVFESSTLYNDSLYFSYGFDLILKKKWAKALPSKHFPPKTGKKKLYSSLCTVSQRLHADTLSVQR